MIAFLDTEFTDLQRPQLLSISLVSMHGLESYVELDLASDVGRKRKKASTEFAQCEVLDQFGIFPPAICGTPWAMGRRTGEWLIGLSQSVGDRVEIAFDYDIDWELMEEVIRDSGLWDRVRDASRPVNVGRLTGTIEGELDAEECFRELSKHKPLLRQHHALGDAWALRQAYLAAKKAALEIAARNRPVDALPEIGITELQVVEEQLALLERRRFALLASKSIE